MVAFTGAPELFIHSLFFLDTDGRFYGKYPIGWPIIVGTFDHLNLLFMANATLTGVAALLTGLVARELAGKRVAVLSVLVFGLSPWVWFHGASFASHVASTCAVWGFLWLFLMSWRKGSGNQKWPSGQVVKWPSDDEAKWSSGVEFRISNFGFRICRTKPGTKSTTGRLRTRVLDDSDQVAEWPGTPNTEWVEASHQINRWYTALPYGLGAGLVLGCAVLIRPGDATNFALPAVIVVLIGLLRAPKKWLPMGAVIALGAMVGVLIYLWSNAQTTGDAFISPYKLEPRWKEDWQPTLGSMLGRFAFQWAEVTARFPGWGVGGLTLSMMGLIVLAQRWRESTIGRGAWVMVLAAVSIFFVFNTTFGFTNVWWGPRWLLPVAPLLAILIAVMVDGLLEVFKPKPGQARALSDMSQPTQGARLLLAIIMAGLMLVSPTMYASKFWEVRVHPPHGVNGAVHRRVTAMGLKDAVVGMSTAGGLFPPDARSGMVMMTVPFEDNPVIYVRNIPDWLSKAQISYPNRKRYEIVADQNDVNGFVIKELTSESQQPTTP